MLLGRGFLSHRGGPNGSFPGFAKVVNAWGKAIVAADTANPDPGNACFNPYWIEDNGLIVGGSDIGMIDQPTESGETHLFGKR